MKPPSKLLWAMEVPRGLFGLATLAVAGPALAQAPRGDGRLVLILPGLFNSDLSSIFLRRYLEKVAFKKGT